MRSVDLWASGSRPPRQPHLTDMQGGQADCALDVQQWVAQPQARNLCSGTLLRICHHLCKVTAASLQLNRAK